MKKFALVIALALTACPDKTPVSSTSTPPSSSLARETGSATAAQCPNGGVNLDYGIDKNENGVLDPNEVNGTVTVCNGLNGTNGVDAVTPTLAKVATTGSYTDLINLPVNQVGTLTPGKWCMTTNGTTIDCSVDLPAPDLTILAGITRACGTNGTQTFSGTAWGACVVPGFFVETSATTSGNLGGLAGANAICLTDLTSNDWLGKNRVPALNSDHVHAFLCDHASCNNAKPGVTYSFAVSGNTARGGATFLSSATGTGPLNSDTWGDDAHFGVNQQYFSNRGTVSVTEWANVPASTDPNYSCQDWSVNIDGIYSSLGDSQATNATRWQDTRSYDYCSSSYSLLCLVD